MVSAVTAIFFFLQFLLILIRMFLTSSEGACSGIIEKTFKDEEEASSGKISSSSLGSFIFNTLSPADTRDNFVEMHFILFGKYRRVLFVTPQIVKWNPDGVKGAFVRLNCTLIGILFGYQELTWLKRGTFFALSAGESRDRLSACLRNFEIRIGIKLRLAMIDSGPDELDQALQEEFRLRNIILMKHPMNISDKKIFYIHPDDFLKNIFIFEDEGFQTLPDWYEYTKTYFRINHHRLNSIFSILCNYELRNNFSFEEQITTVNESSADKQAAMEHLENLFGPLEDIHLTSSESETTTPKPPQQAENLHEIIKQLTAESPPNYQVEEAEELHGAIDQLTTTNSQKPASSINQKLILDEPDYDVIDLSDLK